ncbi:hypothetical protein ACFLWK_01185, partial [Chloroflexota bacterium]
THWSPTGKWGVLSFELETYGVRLLNSDDRVGTEPVWYGIPNRQDFSAPIILRGLREIGAQKEGVVLWVQHEHGIWPDDHKFVAMLKELPIPKVVTFHTIHFQSQETSTGLRRRQYNLLQDLLPHVEAITVFSRGAYRAVAEAFPEYRDKVHILKHGIHNYPEIRTLTRREAKEKLNDYLIYESDLDLETKEALNRERIFLDPNVVVVGQTGFLSYGKNSELLYNIRDNLQVLIPDKRVIVVRIGSARDESQQIYAQQLKKMCNQQDKFLLEIWPEQSILPLAQRAFDVNFYWPRDCTQSGILAHALGAGAIIAGRDLEGVGETLKEAGEPADTDLNNLLSKIQTLILNSEVGEQIQDKALEYAEEHSWERQAQRHYELAEKILTPTPVLSVAHSLVDNDTMNILAASKKEANVPAEIISAA